MEIKKEEKGIDITQKTDPLEGTDLDNVFGLKCPIRSGEIFGNLETWIEQDEVLKQLIEIIRISRKHNSSLLDHMELSEANLRKYFRGEKKDINLSQLFKLEKWITLDKKYDIPLLGFELRKWDFDLAFDYLSKTCSDEKAEKLITNTDLRKFLTIKTAIDKNCLWCLKYALDNEDLEKYKDYGFQESYGGCTTINPILWLGATAFKYMEKAVKTCDIELIKLLYKNGFPDRKYQNFHIPVKDLATETWNPEIRDYIINNRVRELMKSENTY